MVLTQADPTRLHVSSLRTSLPPFGVEEITTGA
jgi:hypothetical protein